VNGSVCKWIRNLQFRDALVAKEREIAELKKEIKTLNVLQKRQTKAIKDMDHQKGELPR
jgi:hypothetical protein